MNLANFRRFQVIIQLGMIHYPTELGFLFHQKLFRKTWKDFGTAAVEKLVDEEFTSNQRYNDKKTLQALVVAAASNNAISLDGVYILARRDPILLLPESYR